MRPDPSRLSARWQALIEGRPFHPHRWLRNAHLQTIVGAKQRRRFPPVDQPITNESIELAAGARLVLTRLEVDASAPTLVAVHGMSGSSESDYMTALSRKALRSGWNSLLFNLYDRNGSRRIPLLFDAGCSAQVVETIEQLRYSGRLGSVIMVGVSMGGNIVLKALGDWGSFAPDWFLGAAVISPLVDLSTSWQAIECRKNWIYRSHYLRRLKRLTRANRCGWESRVDFDRLDRTTSIRQYDEMVTVPVGGYRDVLHYYETASAAKVIQSIQVPTLAIHSRDDPFLPWEPLTRKNVQDNPWVNVVLTDAGGHVGFIEDQKIDSDRVWAENRVVDFFSLLLA